MTKDLIIRKSEKFPTLWEVAYEGGGELPDALKGARYTDVPSAQHAIRVYQATRGKTRAKGTTKS